MAQLRLFAAAFPWQCEVPDTEKSWSFGRSGQSDHQIPDALFADRSSSQRDEIYFHLRGLGEGRWEFVCAHRQKDQSLAEIASKLNGKFNECSILNDGDIITLGDQGHILVTIPQPSIAEESISKIPVGNRAPEQVAGRLSEEMEGRDEGEKQPPVKMTEVAAGSSTLEKKAHLSRTSLEPFLVGGAVKGCDRKESVSSDISQNLHRSRYRKGYLIIPIFLLFGALLLSSTKLEVKKKPLDPPLKSAFFEESDKSKDQLSAIRNEVAEPRWDFKAIEDVQKGGVSDAVDLQSSCKAPQLQHPLLAKRRVSWPILTKYSKKMILTAYPFMQGVGISNDEFALAEKKAKLPLSEQKLSQYEMKSSTRANLPDDLLACPNKMGNPSSMSSGDSPVKADLLSPRWDQQLQALVENDLLFKWLSECWIPITPAMTPYPKQIERSLMIGQLREPLGPPLFARSQVFSNVPPDRLDDHQIIE